MPPVNRNERERWNFVSRPRPQPKVAASSLRDDKGALGRLLLRPSGPGILAFRKDSTAYGHRVRSHWEAASTTLAPRHSHTDH